MRALVRWTVGAVTAAALAGCGDAPSKGDCEKLLDNVVTIELSEAGTEALSAEAKADLDKQKTKLRDYVGKDFIDACTKQLKKPHVACGLKAKTKDELAACEKEDS